MPMGLGPVKSVQWLVNGTKLKMIYIKITVCWARSLGGLSRSRAERRSGVNLHHPHYFVLLFKLTTVKRIVQLAVFKLWRGSFGSLLKRATNCCDFPIAYPHFRRHSLDAVSKQPQCYWDRFSISFSAASSTESLCSSRCFFCQIFRQSLLCLCQVFRLSHRIFLMFSVFEIVQSSNFKKLPVRHFLACKSWFSE